MVTLFVATNHTSSEVDECLVVEHHVVFCLIESELLTSAVGVGRESSVVGKHMSVFLESDGVIADRNADSEVTLIIAGEHLTFLRAFHTVDVESHALHGIVGVGIIDGAADGERRYILEVHTTVDERLLAHEARLTNRREFVDAQSGNHGVVDAFAREGDTSHNVVADRVGVGHQAELLLAGNDVRTLSGHVACEGMSSVRHTVGLREVIGQVLRRNTLVERVIDGQIFLVTC